MTRNTIIVNTNFIVQAFGEFYVVKVESLFCVCVIISGEMWLPW